MIEVLLPMLVAATVAAPHPGAADSLARPVRTLPAVEVAAERVRIDARRRMPTASVTDLAAGADNRAHETLAELLQSGAGARVVAWGGLGAFSTVSLRGAAPGQVAVMLDGEPISSAAHGTVNLSDLPIGAVERIEVYRGGAPLAFGAATPGGAVNLVSADAPDARRARVGAGSFGTRTASGAFGARRGHVTLSASAGYEGWRGDYAFVNDNETPFNLADDRAQTRSNDRFDATHARARLAWAPVPGARVALGADGFHKAQGVPGLGAVQAPNPRLALDRGLVTFEASRAPRGRTPGAVLRARAGGERQRFRDPEGELHLGRQDAATRDREFATALEASSPESWRHVTASLGGEVRAERAQGAPPTIGLASPPESGRDTRAAWAELRLHAANDAIVVQGAFRRDAQRDRVRATLAGNVRYAADASRTLDSPQAGIALRLPLGFELRANVARTTRAPGFDELFGDQGVVAASPRLAPERGDGRDAALAWAGRGPAWDAGAEWARYAVQETDLIGWVPAAARTVRATNFSRAHLAGDELRAHASWRAFALTASAAWSDARQDERGNIYFGKRLPLRPARQDAVRLDVRHGAWRASADVLDLGDDFYDPANRQRLAPRTLAGAALARSWRACTVTLECKNLGDRRVSDVAGYPMPGRSFHVACEWPGRTSSAAARPTR